MAPLTNSPVTLSCMISHYDINVEFADYRSKLSPKVTFDVHIHLPSDLPVPDPSLLFFTLLFLAAFFTGAVWSYLHLRYLRRRVYQEH